MPSVKPSNKGQRTAARAVVQAATGTAANKGCNEIQQLRADNNLHATGGGSDYSNGVYFIAFLGTPSTLGIWMLQFGGHYLATNLPYGSGNVTGTSLKFEGVGRLIFTTNSDVLPSGTTHSLQTQEQAGRLTMMRGLATLQKATILLSGTCGDMAVGLPKDGDEKRTSKAKGEI